MMIFGSLLRLVVLVLLKILQFILFVATLPNYARKPKRCPPITDNILLYSATALAEMIRMKEISSESVVKAYISRIKTVNPIINAVVDERFLHAINEAIYVDQMLSNTKLTADELRTQYPLLGIPITVKESLAVEGLSHCSGKVFPGGKRVALKDSDAVRLSKEAGAIILLVSNTPEMSVNYETYNNVTGTTCNPYDTRRTPGGSSGGEGALLGAGASLISLGTDVGGSLRLPAHFCGVFGHKPSTNTVSSAGHYPNSKDYDDWNLVFSAGPMCRYSADMPLLLNSILKKESVPVLRLNEHVNIENIKFYYVQDRNRSILCNKTERDITQATQKLASYLRTTYRCELQELNLSQFKICPELANTKLFSIDKIEDLFEDRGKGSFGELLRYLTCRSQSVLPPILCGLTRRMLSFLPTSTVLLCNEQISHMKKKFCEILGSNGVLLCPTHPTAAHFHGEMYGRYFDYSDMSIFNCLGFPATHCPLGLNSKGLPIGIQVIATPNNDRITLAIAREIEKAFGGWIPPAFEENHILC